MRKVSSIPFNRNIQELYAFLGLSNFTEEDFHIESHTNLRKALPKKVVPFRNDFYELSIVTKGSSLNFKINQKEFQTPQSYLVCTCPQQVRSWRNIEPDLEGYVLFFKLNYLTDIDHLNWLEKFPFFSIFETNLIELTPEEVEVLNFYYRQIHKNYRNDTPFAKELIQSNLHSILWLCNRKYQQKGTQENPSIKQEENRLTARFRHLVNTHFLSKRAVQDYAELLFVSPNHLSQTVKQTLGVKAKNIIDQRLLVEAEYLLNATPLSIREIAFQLGFTEAAHFNRFFKKFHQQTPSLYRKKT